MTNERSEVTRDAIMSAGASYIGMATGIVTQFMIRRFLGPRMFGIWSAVRVLRDYSGFMHLGLLYSAERELPGLRARGLDSEADDVAGSVLVVNMIVVAIAIVAYAGYAAFFGKNHEPETIFGFYFLAAYYFLAQLLNYLVVVFVRTKKKFRLLAEWTLIFSLIDSVLLAGSAYFAGIYAMYIAFLVSVAGKVIYLKIGSKAKFSFSFKIDIIKKMLAIGLPIFFLNITIMSLRSIDSLFIAGAWGATELGFYSIATMVNGFLLQIPNNILIVLFPRVQERYAINSDDPQSVRFMITTPMIVLAFTLPILIMSGYFLLPPLIELALPKFIEGLPAMRTLIFTSYFFMLVAGPQQFLVTTNRQWSAFAIALVILGFEAAGMYSVNQFGGGIGQIALVIVAANILFYLLETVIGLAKLLGISQLALYFAETITPIVYSIGAARMIESFSFEPAGFIEKIGYSLACLGAWFVAYLPFIYYIQRKTGAPALLFGIGRSMIFRLLGRDKSVN